MNLKFGNIWEKTKTLHDNIKESYCPQIRSIIDDTRKNLKSLKTELYEFSKAIMKSIDTTKKSVSERLAADPNPEDACLFNIRDITGEQHPEYDKYTLKSITKQDSTTQEKWLEFVLQNALQIGVASTHAQNAAMEWQKEYIKTTVLHPLRDLIPSNQEGLNSKQEKKKKSLIEAIQDLELEIENLSLGEGDREYSFIEIIGKFKNNALQIAKKIEKQIPDYTLPENMEEDLYKFCPLEITKGGILIGDKEEVIPFNEFFDTRKEWQGKKILWNNNYSTETKNEIVKELWGIFYNITSQGK